MLLYLDLFLECAEFPRIREKLEKIRLRLVRCVL